MPMIAKCMQLQNPQIDLPSPDIVVERIPDQGSPIREEIYVSPDIVPISSTPSFWE